MRFVKAIAGLVLAVALRAGAGSVLCIGLNDYDNASDLKYAESDAAAIGRIFTRMGHQVQMLTGAQVTSTNVLQALAQRPDLVYFAGHARPGRLMVRDGDIALRDIINAHTIMVLDCCYIGGALKISGTMKILAASEYEAFESGNHGLFTKHLLHWLDNGKDMSSEALLMTYLESSIGAETGGWQRPVMGFI